MSEKIPATRLSLEDRRVALQAEERRLAAELEHVRGAIAKLDGRPTISPSAFEGTNLSPAAQLWLVDHGIKSRSALQNNIFTPRAFLSVMPNPTTDDLGVYDEVSKYCARANAKWTKEQIESVWEELQRRKR